MEMFVSVSVGIVTFSSVAIIASSIIRHRYERLTESFDKSSQDQNFR